MATTEDNIQARLDSTKRQIEPQLRRIQENSPSRQQVLGVLTWLVAGLAVLTVGGVTLTGAAIFLALATLVFIFFSPILVPIGGFLLLSTTGVVVTVGLALAAVSAAVWIYKYLKGEEPVYYDRVDAARNRIAGTAAEVKEWARERAPQVQAAPSA